MKYFKFDHDLSAFDVTDKYDYVRLPYEDVGGKKVDSFQDIPIRRMDQMRADEARVT